MVDAVSPSAKGRAAILPVTVTATVARRYLLGRQGLWPGRRWLGKPGADAAIRALESLQMDTVAVVARSHELALFSRVNQYQPADLDELLYTDRAFFDYGGHLDVYPSVELPYWRLHMRRRLESPRESHYRDSNRALLRRVLETVTEQGPLRASDVRWATPTPTRWRSATDVSQALYHLWITGDLMTHSRVNFRRTFDLATRIAAPEQLRPATANQAQRFFAGKALRRYGLAGVSSWRGYVFYFLHSSSPKETWRTWLDELVDTGAAAWVQVEGVKRPYLMPAEDLPLLDSLARDVVPSLWTGTTSSSAEEVVLLSPLDNLLHPDRDRNLELFDFEFVWEVYKPPAQRRWGAYTMPVLYQDRLVARLEPRLDRKHASLEVLKMWFEDAPGAADPGLLSALATGLVRLAQFHQARTLDFRELRPLRLRQSLRRGARLAGFEAL